MLPEMLEFLQHEIVILFERKGFLLEKREKNQKKEAANCPCIWEIKTALQPAPNLFDTACTMGMICTPGCLT